MVAFAKLAVCPNQPYSSAQVQTLLAQEGDALAKLAPLQCSFSNFDQLRTSTAGSAAAAAGSGSSSTGYASSTSPPPPPPPRQQQQQQGATTSAAGTSGSSSSRAKPVQASYSQLMGMRAKELKRLLQEHGVDSSDCFEKEDLVRRVLERCTAPNT